MLQTAQIGFAVKESLDAHNGSLDAQLKALVQRTARQASASYGFLLLYDPGASEWCHTAWYGRDQALEGHVAVAQWVMSRAEPLFLQGRTDANEIVGYNVEEEALPLLCVPVMCNGSPRGVLGVGLPYSARNEFRRRLPFVESLGEMAGAVLEIADLRKELLHKEAQVRELTTDNFDSQEVERERICLEVHDGLAQTLASAFQYLQTMESTLPEGSRSRQLLLKANGLVKQSIEESREIINSLQPATLRDLGLVATLQYEMRQLEQEMGWEIDFKADAVSLARGVETGLYRIIHEAITNVRKHADTKRLRVRITKADDQIRIEVEDWGVGFNNKPGDMSNKNGTGLLSMRRRAALLQGACDIQSSPGQGTTVRVEIPLAAYRE